MVWSGDIKAPFSRSLLHGRSRAGLPSLQGALLELNLDSIDQNTAQTELPKTSVKSGSLTGVKELITKVNLGVRALLRHRGAGSCSAFVD